MGRDIIITTDVRYIIIIDMVITCGTPGRLNSDIDGNTDLCR
jgi:hypothetical protein